MSTLNNVERHLKCAREFHNYQNDRNFTHPYDEDETCSMQNVVLEENKVFKYTLFSLCPLKKSDSTILTDVLSEYYSH